MSAEMPSGDHTQISGMPISVRGMPRVHAGRAEKSRLTTRFQRPAPLTVLRGPHGFGKSALAAHWLRALDPEANDVLWFGYEEELSAASDPVETFWSLLADRLEDFDEGEPGVTEAPGLDRVLGHFANRTKPIYVVLDQFSEFAPADRGLDQALTGLVRKTENLFLVVCTQEISKIEIVGAAMVESLVVRPADLAMTAQDILALAEQQLITLSMDEAVVLRDETGGWPALVRVILTGSAADRQVGDTFALNLDSGRWFLRYVWDEFANPSVALLVTRTGFMGDFTPQIAQSLCGKDDPTGAIETLVSAGLLDVKHGPEGPLYRHLPAVQREVRHRLSAEDPEQFRELSQRAAQLLHKDGHLVPAMSYLLRAELWEPLLEMVASSWTLLIVKHRQELAEMLRQVPGHVIRTSPHLLVAREHLAEVNQPAGGLANTRLGKHTFGSSLALDAAQATDPEGTAPRGERYMHVAPEVRSRLAEVVFEWAIASLMTVDSYGALSQFEEAYALASAYEQPEMKDRAATGAGLVTVIQGEVDSAESWLATRGSAIPERSEPGFEDRVESLRRIVEAFVTVGRFADRAAIMSLADLPAEHEFDDLWAMSVVARSQAALLAGTQFELLEELEQNQHRLAGRDESDLLRNMIITTKVDLLLSLGQVFRARAALSVSPTSRVSLVVAECRVAFKSGDYAKATLLAGEALRNGLHTPRLKLGVLLTLAAAEVARGRKNEAQQAMQEAVTVSAESGLVTNFAHMRRETLAGFAESVPGVDKILAMLDGVLTDEMFPAPSIVAELSEREREVLIALGEARSLQGVARALYLTTNTVKTHLRSIYRKLGTHSSAETIQKAIECGLIEPNSDD